MSAISGFINQIRTAVYGEQVRGAIVSALEACYSDVSSPSLNTAAFSAAIEAAYANGFLDIQEKSTIAGMTNEKIIYRYTGNQTGYINNALYYYNGTEWVPIGSGLQSVANSSLMTNQNVIYKYTGNQTGFIQNALYYYNGTEWVPIVKTDKDLTESNAPADAKAVGDRLTVLEAAITTSEDAALIKKVGTLEGIINARGVVQSSTLTESLYYPAEADTEYTVVYDGSVGDGNAYFAGDFIGVPAVGAQAKAFYYTTTNTNNRITLKTSKDEGTHYLLVGKGGNKTAELFTVYKGNPKAVATSADDWTIGGVNINTGEYLANNQRLRTSNFIRVTNGTRIYASGREFVWAFYDAPSLGNYVKSQSSTEFGTEEHTFDRDGYIIMVVKSSEDITTELKEEIVSDVTIFINVSEIWKSIQNSLIDAYQEVKSSNYISVGQPYAYLSETIEDEILDSKTVDDVYAIYDDLCTNHPETMVRLPDIGTETSQNLPIRMYRLKWTEPWLVNVEASWSPSNNLYSPSYDNYRHLLITSGTHGNEKSSVYGVALAIKEIVESDKEFAKYIRANFSMDIIPIVNPAGFNATTRNNGNNVNINRDFHTRATAEAQAVYNVLTSNEYYACIDSHNSGGNANYIGATKTNKLLSEYVQIAMKFGQIFYNDWVALCEGEQYATPPYMQFWSNNDEGMLQDLFTELGQVGYLIETVGVFASSSGTLTPNHKKYCKFTKDLFVNSIIALGTENWEAFES